MNFQSLKTMIDNLVQTYACPSCTSKIDDTNVEIVWTAGSNINVEVACPQCEKHSIIRAQVIPLDLPSLNISKEQIEWIKWQLWITETKNEDRIKDSQIVDLNRAIKKNNCSIEELFNDNQK